MTDLFHDPDAQAARRGDGRIPLGEERTLVLPRVTGFCHGVRAALQQLESVLARTRGRVWLFGEIIHNDTVNEHFRQRGVHILPEGQLEDSFAATAAGDTFVIPAFGLERDLERRLRAFADDVVDTTCDCVKLVWAFVEAQAAARRTILLHGKPNHPETRATLSRALTPANAAIVVPDLDHARWLANGIHAASLADYPPELVHHPDHVDLTRLAMANQTTMLFSETRKLESIIAAGAAQAGGELLPAKTVCKATQARQDAARRVCADGVDLILVLGGFTSSNTNQLLRLASNYAPAFFIGKASALTSKTICHFDPETKITATSADWLPPPGARIALLAGASCPPGDIGEVIRTLRQLTGLAPG
ncbi:MAG: hypothetical protein HN904_07950 [Victivallales bacterium]|nr:hypothetical protein [Victivallales bacterium]